MNIPPFRGSIYHTTFGLPDPIGTPGALNPSVTEATIATTIAVKGWTAKVRPPLSYTTPLKKQVMREYSLTGKTTDYELDHLVPLCCGGHPTSQLNLWPQSRFGTWSSATKDIAELLALHAILGKHLSLAEVQSGFANNWYLLYLQLSHNRKLMWDVLTLPHPDASL